MLHQARCGTRGLEAALQCTIQDVSRVHCLAFMANVMPSGGRRSAEAWAVVALCGKLRQKQHFTAAWLSIL